MSVRSLGYDSEALDHIICYFMRTVLRLQKSGIENLPLKNRGYPKFCVNLLSGVE